MSGPIPDFVAGGDGYAVLPPGRYTCTYEDFYDRFVDQRTADRSRREQIVTDFLSYREQQLRCGLVVTSYWIDGSFASDKTDPGDIDITAVIDGSASSPVDDYADWLNPRDTWKTLPHQKVGRTLLVDGFSIVKVPDSDPGVDVYRQMRGYWDDWWQRSRVTGATTVKGYAEVVF